MAVTMINHDGSGMITFKQYLTENYDFKIEIARYLKTGEIIKPDFENIKRDINKAVEKDSRIIFDKFWLGRGNAMYNEYGEFADVVSYPPDSINGINGLGKKLTKFKKSHGSTAYFKDLQSFYDKYIGLVGDFAKLKEIIVTVKQKCAEKKEVEAKVQAKRFSDAKSLTSTLLTHKDEFVNEAAKRGGEYFKKYYAALKKAGSLDAIAPAPHYKMGRDEYQAAKQKRAFYFSISKGSVEQYAKMYADAAHDDYMAWIHKLTAKIGKPVTKSSITGSPWQGSTINVTCNDGEEQTWHTQMIINHSKYGKPFNQFPTRRKK